MEGVISLTEQVLAMALCLGAVLGASTAFGSMAAIRLIRRRGGAKTIQRLARRGPRCRYCGDPTPAGEPVCAICAFFVKEAA